MNNPPSRLPPSRNEKLKVFAILAKHKSIPHELLKDKLMVAIVIAYNPAEAVMGAFDGLRQTGNNINEYQPMPYMMIGRELDQIVPIQVSPEEQEADAGFKVAQAKNDETTEKMINRVRYVFAEVGTPIENEVMEGVIDKFREYAAKQ